MTRDEAKELLPVIQAYAEGKDLECRHKTAPEEGWMDSDSPCFDFSEWEYRIKPEPKYRPFRNTEERWQTIRLRQSLKLGSWMFIVQNYPPHKVKP